MLMCACAFASALCLQRTFFVSAPVRRAPASREVFIRPALRAAMGLPDPDRPRRTAVLSEDLTSPRGKRQFRRGVLDGDAVTSYGPPASHHLRWLASANCLLELDEATGEVAAGERVPVWDLR